MTNVDKANMLVHPNMPVTLGASEEDGQETICYYIRQYGANRFLDNDSKGDPRQMTELHNATQAIGAGAKWIMTNGKGLSDVNVDFCKETLGFDGVVVTDWGQVNLGANGITADGFDLSTLSYGESFAWIINNGVDQVGINNLTLEESKNAGNCYYLVPFHEAVENGLISAELERQLQAASAILVRNDDVLPLAKGAKVYIDSTNGVALPEYKAKLAAYATVVDTIDEADVVVVDCTQRNDAAELMVDDAKSAGKPLVIVTNCVDPNAWAMENGDAVLFMNLNRTPDHGRGTEGIVMTTEPSVYAELLFGEREPSGMIVKEIARDEAMEDDQWMDLAGDMGASMDVRMILEAIMLSSDDHATPNNYGDPLLCYRFGMRYGQAADFKVDRFIVPTEVIETRYEMLPGLMMTQRTLQNVQQKSGEPFTVYAIVFNNGGDGVLDVAVLDNGVQIAGKTMAVCGDSWRILKMDITLNGAGEHTLTLGGMTKTISVVD